jgi:type II secretory pathway component PulF
MIKYYYKAMDGTGKAVKGDVEAEDESKAVLKIKELGLFPTALTESAPTEREENESSDPVSVDPSIVDKLRSLITEKSEEEKNDLLFGAAVRIYVSKTQNGYTNQFASVKDSVQEAKDIYKAVYGE